jgi:hypothetical protein
VSLPIGLACLFDFTLTIHKVNQRKNAIIPFDWELQFHILQISGSEIENGLTGMLLILSSKLKSPVVSTEIGISCRRV